MSGTVSSQLRRGGGGTPPAAPTSVSATVSSTTAKAINLTWTQSSDPAGDPVVGYRVYRGGSLIATVGRTGSYADSGLAYSTSYTYTVKAYNTAGGDSPLSGSSSATTYAACSGGSGNVTGSNGSGYGSTSGTSSPFTVPNGCFKVRSRALGGGGGGGYYGTSVHLGSCYPGSGGGGGGGYQDENITVSPGASLVAWGGHGGAPGYPGGFSGIKNSGGTVQGSGAGGGGGGGVSSAGAGGTGSTSGASGTYGGSPWSSGGAAALVGTDPTGGGRTHASGATNGFGDRCSCGTGTPNSGYGGGGAGGADCGSLWGEAYMVGGSGGRGYVVWDISES